MHHITRPHHHDDGVERRQVFGQGVMAGKQQHSQADQRDAFDRLFGFFQQGIAGHEHTRWKRQNA
ncbi:hypothetical protein D3C76_1487610 [compost metagenome]